MNKDKQLIGKKIFAARKKAQMSRVELGKIIKLHETTIKKYEDGQIKSLDIDKLKEFAKALNISPAYLIGWEENPSITKNIMPVPKGGKRVPILGKVAAGMPIDVIEDVLGHVEISADYEGFGDFFALQVKGDSMSPQINSGDIVIVQKYFELASGDIVVVTINGDEATCKQIFQHENGIMIQAFNPAVFPARFYSLEEIETLPINIIGKVIEARRSFNKYF